MLAKAASALSASAPLLVATALIGGCSASDRRTPTAPAASPAASPGPPARWFYRPLRAPESRGSIETQEGALHIDAVGGRWLAKNGKEPIAAAEFAPEPLVRAVVRSAPGAAPGSSGYAFVGQSGAVYSAGTALGDFVDVHRPPEPLTAASSGGQTIIGASASGVLYRSLDLGNHWQRVPLAGFAHAAFVLSGGAELALTVPEVWHRSEGSGAPFERIGGSVAPRRFGRDPAGRLALEGALGSFVFDGEVFVPGQLAPVQPPPWRAALAPAASRVLAGEATLGERYLELRARSDGGTERLTARFGEPPRQENVEGLPKCDGVRVASQGQVVLAVCALQPAGGSTPRLVPLLSRDGGAHFETIDIEMPRRERVEVRGALQGLVADVLESGVIAFGPVCRFDEAADGCTEDAILVTGPGAVTATLAPPWMESVFDLALVTRAGGPELWVVGESAKSSHLELWRVGFARTGSGLQPVERQGLELGHRILPGAEFLDATLLEPDTRGARVVLVTTNSRTFAVTVDADLGFERSVAVPTHLAVGGHGEHLVALEAGARSVAVSADGGVSWEREPMTREAICTTGASCRVGVVCAEAGCIVGDELLRAGWGVSRSNRLSYPGAGVREGAARARGRSFACTFRGSAWRDLGDIVAVPGADDAALDGALFAQVSASYQTGEVSRVVGTLEGVQTHTLLPPLGEPRRFALYVSQQVEGSAALRYRVSELSASQTELSHVEVAWDNRITDVASALRLPGVFTAEQMDVTASGAAVRRAHPALLSVAGRGVYVRLHASGRGPLFYVEGGGGAPPRIERPAGATFPAALANGAVAEVLRVGAHDVPILLAQDRSTLLWANSTTGPAGAMLLLPPDPKERGLALGSGIGYRGKDVGIVSLIADTEGKFWFGALSVVGPGGVEEVLELPLLADVGTEFRACSAEERATTARTVAPGFPGPEHVFSIDDPELGRVRLSSQRAVLFGTRARPCIAALEAEEPMARTPVSGRSTHERDTYTALVEPQADGALAGWLFRAGQGGGHQVSPAARGLRCEPD